MSIQTKKLYPERNGRITVTRHFEGDVRVEDCIHALLRHVDALAEDNGETSAYEDTHSQDFLEV